MPSRNVKPGLCDRNNAILVDGRFIASLTVAANPTASMKRDNATPASRCAVHSRLVNDPSQQQRVVENVDVESRSP
jgi:hypothetical protein